MQQIKQQGSPHKSNIKYKQDKSR